jgi:DNA-binding NtrC family response regulator
VAESRTAPAALPARSVRVLLVEDQAIVREHMEAQLRDLGHEVVAAPDATTALAALRADSDIGLLLTDLVLPGGIGGRDLAAAARRLRPGLPILLASGHGDGAAEGEEGLPILAKPYRRRDLAAMITRALGRPG